MHPKQQYPGIDGMKFLMSFFVIAIHTLIFSPPVFLVKVLRYTVDSAVPFFFIASGFLMFSSRPSLSREQACSVIKRTLLRILKLYSIWALIYLPIAFCNYYLSGTRPAAALLDFIRNAVFNGDNYYSWHLWYLLSSVYSLLFFYLGIRFLHWKKAGICISALGSLLLIWVVDWIVHAPWESRTLGGYLRKAISITIVDGRIFTGLFYFALGFLLAGHQDAVRRFSRRTHCLLYPAVFLACASTYALTDRINPTFLRAVSSAAVFALCIFPSDRPHPLAVRLRKYSTVIYLTHMLWFFLLTYPVFRNPLEHSLRCFLGTSVLSLCFSVLLVAADRKGKLFRVLF